MMLSSDTKRGLLLLLLDHFQKITGRTRIQKMLYLANQIGWNVINDYHFYQYGPYSDWVKRELDTLDQGGLIEEIKNEDKFGDRTIYDYKITTDGSKYLKTIFSQPPPIVEKTKKFFDTLRNYSTDDLEIMTSLYFLKKSDPEIDTTERLVKLVKLYKPRFDEPKITKNLQVFNLVDDFTKN
jgi:uncharacterized protein YwgA